jgi:hypothetical protein
VHHFQQVSSTRYSTRLPRLPFNLLFSKVISPLHAAPSSITIPSVERSSSPVEVFIQSTPNKAAKLELKDVRIKELEAKLVELYQFIIEENMLASKSSRAHLTKCKDWSWAVEANPLVRQQIQNHPGAAKRCDTAIKT